MGYNVTDIEGSVMQAGRKYESRIVSILIDLNDFLHFELNGREIHRNRTSFSW